MSKNLEIILVEDESVYASYYTSLLEEAKISSTITLVSDKESFHNVIKNMDIDLVLADYNLSLPTFNGLDALAMFRQAYDVKPFIFVTASMSEEQELETVDLGATDLVFKDSLRGIRGLAYVVKRALNEANAYEASRQKDYFLRESQRAADIGSYQTDFTTGLWQSSEGLDEIFGIDDSFSRTVEGWSNLIHPSDREELANYLQTHFIGEKKKFDKEYRIIRLKDGKERWVHGIGDVMLDSMGTVVGMIGTIQDITNQKKLQEGLIKSERLEALGVVAAGIAHDFNNVISTTMMTADRRKRLLDNLAKKLSPDDPDLESLRRYNSNIDVDAVRGSEIVRHMMSIARQGKHAKDVVNLRHLVEANKIFASEITRPVQAELGVHYKILSDIDKVSDIIGDPGDIDLRVLKNLIQNSIEAMPNGGTLNLTCKNVEFNQEYIGNICVVLPGHYVRMTIEDNGTGIPEMYLRKILDEGFFTTKDKGTVLKKEGEGTGLGMMNARMVVKSHDGYFDITTTQGKGTRIDVYFPAVRLQTTHTATIEEKVMPHGTERILLVEDDENTRLVLRDELEALGYTVEDAGDAFMAKDMYLKNPRGHYDIIITDIGLPNGMNGAQLRDDIIRTCPDQKFVGISGYNPERTQWPETVPFITKPATQMVLANKLYDALHPDALHPKR